MGNVNAGCGADPSAWTLALVGRLAERDRLALLASLAAANLDVQLVPVSVDRVEDQLVRADAIVCAFGSGADGAVAYAAGWAAGRELSYHAYQPSAGASHGSDTAEAAPTYGASSVSSDIDGLVGAVARELTAVRESSVR